MRVGRREVRQQERLRDRRSDGGARAQGVMARTRLRSPVLVRSGPGESPNQSTSGERSNRPDKFSNTTRSGGSGPPSTGDGTGRSLGRDEDPRERFARLLFSQQASAALFGGLDALKGDSEVEAELQSAASDVLRMAGIFVEEVRLPGGEEIRAHADAARPSGLG
jgi:hypothetical protein